jgi:hypothetical protein
MPVFRQAREELPRGTSRMQAATLPPQTVLDNSDYPEHKTNRTSRAPPMHDFIDNGHYQ